MGFGRGQGRMRLKVECVGWCFKDKKLEKGGRKGFPKKKDFTKSDFFS